MPMMHEVARPSRRLVLAGLATSLPVSSRPANAQTIATLKASGTLRAGVQVSQAPWGFMDSSGRNEGFEIDLMRAFCAEQSVAPEFTAMTTSTRIPTLLASKIDVIAAVMGIYPDRQKVVLFSRPYCNLDTVFIGRVGQSVKGWSDLKGLVVGVPAEHPRTQRYRRRHRPKPRSAGSRMTPTRFRRSFWGHADIVGAAATQVANLDTAAWARQVRTEIRLEQTVQRVRRAQRANRVGGCLERFRDPESTEWRAEGTLQKVDRQRDVRAPGDR